MIIKSKKEIEFVNKLNEVGCINTTNIQDCKILEYIIQKFVLVIEELWIKHFKYINITK